MSAGWVFGYGSLAERPGAQLATLRGFRRCWGVAMDNSVDLPGYKYYVDPATGERPPLFVTFVDVVEDAGAAVNGVVFPVDRAELELLDARERNYTRRAVALDAVEGPAWVYTGSDAARERCARGRSLGRAAVDAGYLELVRASFGALGGEELARFDRLTDPPGVPVRPLRRIDLR